MPRRDLKRMIGDASPFQQGGGLDAIISTPQEPAEIVTGDETTLSNSEREELERCERIIDHGLRTFFEVGTALIKIRELRLYRTEYATFEEYCQQRWELKQSRAYQFIDAARTLTTLQSSTIGGTLPTNERQIRPLTRLEPEQQREAWQRAIQTAPDGRVTAAHVEKVVRNLSQTLEALTSTTPSMPNAPPQTAALHQEEHADEVRQLRAERDALLQQVKETEAELQRVRQERDTFQQQVAELQQQLAALGGQ